VPSDPLLPLAILPARLRVQRADVAQKAYSLELRIPGETLQLLIGKTQDGPRVGLVRAQPRKAAWGDVRLPGLARRDKNLEGAALVRVEKSRVLLELGNRSVWLSAEGQFRASVALPESDAASADEIAITAAHWEAGRELLRDLPGASRRAAEEQILRGLHKCRERLHRRQKAVESDIAKMDALESRAKLGVWFVAEAKKAPRGTKLLSVTDWSSLEDVSYTDASETKEPRIVTLTLDPAKGALEQVEALFARAKRMKAGRVIAGKRLHEVQASLDVLQAAETSVPEAESLEAVFASLRAKFPAEFQAAQEGGSAVQARAAEKSKSGTKKHERRDASKGRIRTYEATDGAKILVGKNSEGNHELTMHLAKPNDIWLHAKDRAGSHVLVPMDKGKVCPDRRILEAAHLAAHHSDVRAEAIVDVQITEKRHLRKPKGSAPGFVLLSKERVLSLRVDRALLSTLLERELDQ
jgi:NFACT N-terminal and middle domains/NFACT protein RNA binding domain